MSAYAKTRILTAGILVVLTTIVVPAAFAADKPDPEHRYLGTTMPVESPTDAVDRTLINESTRSVATPSPNIRDAIAPEVAPVVVGAGETGFDWSDAGLGAAGASALMLLMLGAWGVAGRRRSDPPSGVGVSVVQH